MLPVVWFLTVLLFYFLSLFIDLIQLLLYKSPVGNHLYQVEILTINFMKTKYNVHDKQNSVEVYEWNNGYFKTGTFIQEEILEIELFFSFKK